jgi:hypothetical protein
MDNRALKVSVLRKLGFIDAALPPEVFIIPVVVIYYTRDLGFTFEVYSAFLSIILLVSALLEVPLGYLADRIGRIRAYLIGRTGVLAALASTLFCREPEELFAVGLFIAVFQSLGSGTIEAVYYEAFKDNGSEDELIPLGHRWSGISLVVTSFAAAIGGFLSDHTAVIAFQLDLAVMALGLSVSLIALVIYWPTETGDPSAVPSKDDPPAPRPDYSLARLLDGLTGRFLLAAGILAVLSALMRTSLNFYQPLMDEAGMGEWAVGVLFAVGIFLSGVVSIAQARLFTWTARGALLFAGVALVASALCFWIGASAWMLLAVGFLMHQIVRVIVPTVLDFELQDSIPHGSLLRSTLLSISYVLSAALTSLSVFVAGHLASTGWDFRDIMLWLHSATVFAILAGLGVYAMAGHAWRAKN